MEDIVAGDHYGWPDYPSPAALPSVPSLTRTRELLFKMQTPTRTPHPRTAKYEKHKIAYLTHKP